MSRGLGLASAAGGSSVDCIIVIDKEGIAILVGFYTAKVRVAGPCLAPAGLSLPPPPFSLSDLARFERLIRFR